MLDEPNANLDDAGDAALVKAIQDLKARGRTVFVITHRLNVLAIADRLLVLNNGVIQADGPREEVARHAARAGRGDRPPSPGVAPTNPPDPQQDSPDEQTRMSLPESAHHRRGPGRR